MLESGGAALAPGLNRWPSPGGMSAGNDRKPFERAQLSYTSLRLTSSDLR